jgi:hypothetical protein
MDYSLYPVGYRRNRTTQSTRFLPTEWKGLNTNETKSTVTNQIEFKKVLIILLQKNIKQSILFFVNFLKADEY